MNRNLYKKRFNQNGNRLPSFVTKHWRVGLGALIGLPFLAIITPVMAFWLGLASVVLAFAIYGTILNNHPDIELERNEVAAESLRTATAVLGVQLVTHASEGFGFVLLSFSVLSFVYNNFRLLL